MALTEKTGKPASRYKKLVLLHSNDMHGDFTAEKVDSRLVGGVSLLSGYIDRVRKEEPNTLYCIAGDMFQGSVIDTEYKGISTIEIMNALSPDVVTPGNHEVDYGVPHLLFLEKCARFPLINANMYSKVNGARLFRPYVVRRIGGMKILFIGILTEEVMAQAKKEALIGNSVEIREAPAEIGRICNAFKAADVDLTVLLTHIGFEEDKKLAASLDPDWGIDMIIGGHSHTLPEAPAVVNDILIVQAGTGTDYIGRFDLTIDTEENRVSDYQWQIVPIDDAHCRRDPGMDALIGRFTTDIDRKYNRVVTRFRRELTHPTRLAETELGNLAADIVRDTLDLDIMMVASGSIRVERMGPLVLLADLTEGYPFDDRVFRVMMTGKQLAHILTHMLRDEIWTGAHCEFYQLSRGMKVVYSKSEHELRELSLYGEPILPDKIYTVGFQEYHLINIEKNLDISIEELAANRKPRVAATSVRDILDEYFTERQHLDSCVEGRITIVE